MRTRLISKFTAWAALLCLEGIGFADPVNFTLRRGHLIVIPVTINGMGPHDFLLDTGASTTLLTPEFARQLRLRPIDRIELVTVAGSQILVRSELERVTVGAQTATDVEVLISELREVRAAGSNIQGVLGQNFMARFNYLIDYGAQRLEFEASDELETRLCGARLPLEERAGRWLVTISVIQKDWQQHWRFVPDTGVATLLMFAREEVALDWVPDTMEARLARTDVGSQQVQQWRVRSLQLGPVKFTDLPVIVLAAAQAGEGRSENGLLPTSLFQRVYFNHRRGYLILNPGADE
ncbi:MAG: aspartyl protease family protein [Acidobacteriota bacterium]